MATPNQVGLPPSVAARTLRNEKFRQALILAQARGLLPNGALVDSLMLECGFPCRKAGDAILVRWKRWDYGVTVRSGWVIPEGGYPLDYPSTRKAMMRAPRLR